MPLQALLVSPFLISLGAVALAEIGDKTQLLSLVLAAKFKKPWPICAGILIASLLSHAIAAELGAWLERWMTPGVHCSPKRRSRSTHRHGMDAACSRCR